MAAGELTTSQMVLERSRKPAVRQLARDVIDYHKELDPAFSHVASRAGMGQPAELDDAGKEFIAKLTDMNGTDFDKMYVEGQKMDHRQSVDLLRKQAESGATPELRELAADRLPAAERMAARVEEVGRSMAN